MATNATNSISTDFASAILPQRTQTLDTLANDDNHSLDSVAAAVEAFKNTTGVPTGVGDETAILRTLNLRAINTGENGGSNDGARTKAIEYSEADQTISFATKDDAQLRKLDDPNSVAFSYVDPENGNVLVAAVVDGQMYAMYVDPEDFANGLAGFDFGDEVTAESLVAMGFTHVADNSADNESTAYSVTTPGGVKFTFNSADITREDGDTGALGVYASLAGEVDGEEVGAVGVEMTLDDDFTVTAFSGEDHTAMEALYLDGNVAFATGFTETEEDAGEFFSVFNVSDDSMTTITDGDEVMSFNASDPLKDADVDVVAEVSLTAADYGAGDRGPSVEVDQKTVDALAGLLGAVSDLADTYTEIAANEDIPQATKDSVRDSVQSIIDSTANVFSALTPAVNQATASAETSDDSSDDVSTETADATSSVTEDEDTTVAEDDSADTTAGDANSIAETIANMSEVVSELSVSNYLA